MRHQPCPATGALRVRVRLERTAGKVVATGNAWIRMATPLKLLVVEDEENDFLLLLRELERGQFEPQARRVQNQQELEQALAGQPWDVVVADYSLPSFTALAALQTVKALDADLPFIVVSGAIGEETAVALMRAGAQDYMMKSALGRLVPAIHRELQDAETRRGRRESERALRHAHERLRALSGRMLEIQEQEKRHIARELHDEIGQVLTAVKINLQSVQLAGGPNPDRPGVAESIAAVDEALVQVRSLSLDLRPPQLDDLGLGAALRWFVDRKLRIAGVALELNLDPAVDRLPAALETACFRIVQEAVTNALRHAQPQRIAVEVNRVGDTVHLLVKDDGCGFDVAGTRAAAPGTSFGMAGIEERAMLAGGRAEFRSRPGSGTEVHAWLDVTESTGQGLPRNSGRYG